MGLSMSPSPKSPSTSLASDPQMPDRIGLVTTQSGRGGRASSTMCSPKGSDARACARDRRWARAAPRRGAGRGAEHERSHRPSIPSVCSSPLSHVLMRGSLRSRHTIPLAWSSSSSDGARPTRSHHTSRLCAPRARGSVGHRRGLAHQPRVGRLLAQRAEDGVVDGDEIVARREVGVEGDVARACRPWPRARRGRRTPAPPRPRVWLEVHCGHQRVDGVAVAGPVGQGGEAGVLEQVEATHGTAQAAEVGVAPGHHADVVPVGGRVVVEGRRVRQPVALAGCAPSRGGRRPGSSIPRCAAPTRTARRRLHRATTRPVVARARPASRRYSAARAASAANTPVR